MDLPRPPDEIELRNIIDKLAQFVARNGPEFEHMTKNKQRDNPKFAFLFGGEFFNYYQFRVTTEQAILKQKTVREQSQPMSYPPTNYAQHPPENHNIGPPPMANYNRNYQAGNFNPGSSWQQQQQPPHPMSGHHMPPFNDPRTAFPPQTDLIALKGAKDILIAQQSQLQEQIRQSELNLTAQHKVTAQQQKNQTDEIVHQQLEIEAVQRAQECGINPTELDALLAPILESCTKESISQGKAWILHYVAQPYSSTDALVQYLLFKSVQSSQFSHKLHVIYLINDVLHHCVRKGADTLLRSLTPVVPIMYSSASSASDDEQRSKLDKLLTLWQSKSNFFERGVLERLQESPTSVWNEYYSSLSARYGGAISAAVGVIQQTYENYRGQHQAFVNHANHQIATLEQQKQQIEDQIASFAQQPPFVPDYLCRPPPISGPPPSVPGANNFPAEGITPKAPYFDLPAGLLVPLVKLDDREYKSIDPKDIRLPPPLPPSDRLIAAVDFFYAPPSHDRPRNVDGWEQLALYEFFKSKTAAKKKREEDLAAGLREPSPPQSPIFADKESAGSHEVSNGGRNGVKSPARRRYRSQSPEEENDDGESRRGGRPRSRSPSPPRRVGSLRRHRSRSGSPLPRRRSISRSRSRSNSPPAPSFQRQRSPPPQTELASVSFAKGMTQKLDENNRGHQLLRKMGWGGAGLGANEQGIAEPIKGGEARDRVDQFKGVGIDVRDPFENFRKSKGQAFITRMRSRAEEREKEGGTENPPTP